MADAQQIAPPRGPVSPERDWAEPPAAPARDQATLIVENMHCGGCMRAIEGALSETDGVIKPRANLSAKRVTVEFEPDRIDVRGLIDVLDAAGFKAGELADGTTPEAVRRQKDLLKRVGVAGFAAANIMLLSVSVWAGAASDMEPAVRTFFHWLSALIALPAVAYAGQPFFTSARQALRAWRLNMDVPISLAIVLATAMSLFQTVRGTEQVYFDAAVMLLFFLLTGRYLDQSLRARAQGVAQNLLGLQAAWASVIAADGTVTRLPARDIAAGQRVLVAAGERVPVDGAVLTGPGDLDESLLTGETAPRTVKAGDRVYAGTLSLTAPLEIETTAADDATLLAEIARLTAAAEQAKGRYVRLADRAAGIYAPAVHVLGALTFAGWLIAGAGWEMSLTVAIAVLIITCPCALALAVPAVQVAAASRLFSRGIILKAADGLERLAEVDTVVFDKTGTLTFGTPQLVDADQVSKDVLARAAALAVASRHPYARAVATAAAARGIDVRPAEGVREIPGSGLIRGDGDTEKRLGSAAWCGVAPSDGGASLVYARAGAAPVFFRFEDALRDDAAEIVARLQEAGLAIELLSGDRRAAVEPVARDLGVAEWRGEVRPDEKIARVQELMDQGRKVLMVGDGLNDAPALAAGHASLSPANAADISQTASDCIFQGALLAPVAELLGVARRTRQMALQNFAIAALYNAICIPLAVAGLVTPLIAAVAMSASSIVVTANALRLRTGDRGALVMTALAWLIPVALFLGLVGLAAFLWALNTGQFEDLDGAAHRILDDDEPPDPKH